MLQRLLHSLALFVAILVAYQAYVLAMVPWIEPQLALKQSRPVDDEEVVTQGGESVTKYQRLLAAYFPADHWSQTRPPIVIENDAGTVMFVLDEYQRSNDGRVDLSHFAFLIFPTPRQAAATPPRNAVILEAPQGARLQFDKNFRPERGEIGAIQRGEFPGKITIRSDMNEPGPEDDLIIETANLAMNSKMLYTESEVRFRLGPNVGGGRKLEIHLLEEEPSKAQAGLKIVSVDSLEIFHDVRLRLHLGNGSLLPGNKPRPAAKSANATKLGDPVQPPMEVTCTGPFYFDFIKYVASFDQNVEVWQVNPEGAADQLSADRLDLCFARKDDTGSVSQSANLETANRQRADARLLEPDRIVAEGFPVRITSPSRNAEVRGRRVQLMLRERKVAIDGGDDVSLAYGPNILSAPQIRYQHPADDAQTKIGIFRASGPGSLRYLPDERRPDQVFEASWQATVELGRHNGQPVLTVTGRPTMGVTNVGLLTADQVRMFFREVETNGKTQPVPDRMNAVGQVEVNSPELFAHTRRLEARFYDDPPGSPAAPNAAGQGSGGLANLGIRNSAGPAARQYDVQSDEMQLRIALRGKRAVPTTLACNGHVEFGELPGPQSSGEEPFKVAGGQLTAERLDGDALVTVRGAAPSDPNQAASPTEEQLAQIGARGMTVVAADVKLDVGQNRLWIDGPGTANMMLKRSLTGSPTAAATPLQLQWQGGLSFDGRTITIERGVEVEGPDDHLSCDVAAATLTSHVDFRERVDQNSIDLLEVTCRGRVKIDHRSRDDVGITSHERMELERLTVNQQTGGISGDGPGTIRSSHYASQMSALATPGAPAAPATGNTKLHFLRVDFQQGLEGNLYLRTIKFLARVRAIYGPIDAWEQELDANRPELLPPDTLTLTSEELRVNEDPVISNHRTRDLAEATKLPIGYIQMTAERNVRIDGQSPAKGQFYATADRASYTQVKEQFILEGSNRIPATLAHRNPVTGQQIDNSAGKIIFNRLTGEAQWDAVRTFEFTPGAGSSIKSAVGPSAVRQ